MATMRFFFHVEAFPQNEVQRIWNATLCCTLRINTTSQKNFDSSMATSVGNGAWESIFVFFMSPLIRPFFGLLSLLRPSPWWRWGT